MTNFLDSFLNECECETKYTIEPHGDGYALYYGRCNHRHGYNLVYMKEPAFNFDPEHIEKMINFGQYAHNNVDKNTDSAMNEPLEIYKDLDEALIEFWHSDETEPFIKIYADKLSFYSDYVEVYNRDYTNPILIVKEYDFWRKAK